MKEGRRQKSGTQTSVTMETIGSRNGEFRVFHTKATHAITDREIHRCSKIKIKTNAFEYAAL